MATNRYPKPLAARLEPDLRSAVLAVASEGGMPAAAVIRQALMAYGPIQSRLRSGDSQSASYMFQAAKGAFGTEGRPYREEWHGSPWEMIRRNNVDLMGALAKARKALEQAEAER